MPTFSLLVTQAVQVTSAFQMDIAQTGELKQLLLWFMTLPHSKTNQDVVPSALSLGEVQVPEFPPHSIAEALVGGGSWRSPVPPPPWSRTITILRAGQP